MYYKNTNFHFLIGEVMAKQMLIETLKTPGLVLVEGNQQALPSGVLCILEGQIGTYDIENYNKRVYPKSLWENVIKNSEIQEKMEAKSLWGCADHPSDTLETSVTRISHCMRRIWLDEAKNQVMGRLDVLDTPAGRIISTLARYGSIGISSRGSGELKMMEGKSIVDPSTYEYLTHDCVADPACAGSFPKMVMENIARDDLDSVEVQKDFDFFNEMYSKLGVNLTEMRDTKNILAETKIQEEKEDKEVEIESKEEVTSDLSRIEFLEGRITELTETISTLTETSNIKDSESKKMNTLISVVEETRNELQNHIESLNEKIVTEENKNQALVEKLKNIEGKNEILIQSIEKQRNQFEKRIKRISTTDSKNVEEIKILQVKVNETKIQALGLKTELEEKTKALVVAEEKVRKELKLRTNLEETYKLLNEQFEQFKSQHTMPRVEVPKKSEDVFVENSIVQIKENPNERLSLMLSKM